MKRNAREPRAGRKWNRAALEPIMADIRTGMKKTDVAKKHNIHYQYLLKKEMEYNLGELK